jgi:hypothetical protein
MTTVGYARASSTEQMSRSSLRSFRRLAARRSSNRGAPESMQDAKSSSAVLSISAKATRCLSPRLAGWRALPHRVSGCGEKCELQGR